jgi:hypothetical protein
VGLPPSDPSDSSSSDEAAGPRRRIPIGPSRRRRDPRPKEEEDKAEQFFQSMFDQLTQPTATEVARKPKMPDMKAPQIFTGKDKALF